MHSRALSVLAATLAGLALAAAPALAGEDDDGEDDSAAEVQNLPAPAAGGAPAGAPRGGVDTGFGGTAPADDTVLLLGLVSGGLLLTVGGGVVAQRRRAS